MNWLRRLMYGRYGGDQLNNAILALALLLLVVEFFVPLKILSLLVMVFLVLGYARMFSRNIQKRYAENQKFLTVWRPVTSLLHNKKAQFQDRKVHRYLKCPGCKKTLRVPRGHGKINVTCPQCGKQFLTKS